MLVSQGYREIVLTGVNVGDYGQGKGLLPLLRELEQIEGLSRIRISSIEPNLLSDEILELVAESSVVCHHFHIPLQSGNDDILRSMRRRYRSEHYAGLVQRIKNRMPDCGIGVDVITGFPGETDSHFESTCRFIEDLPVSYLHVFTYSERPNTPAREFGRPVRPEVRYHRSRVLRTLGLRKKGEFLRGMIGKTEMVLFEGQVENGLRFGLTGHYVRVGIPGSEAEENMLAPVHILRSGIEDCEGSLVRREVSA
jgi:threonylcarbamoyladenosine tRNA methylthiotransferase MtaB